MGRKGGGRAGFMKASRAQVSDDESDQEQVKKQPPAAPAPETKTVDKPEDKEASQKPTVSKKASAFLVGAKSDDDSSDDGDQDQRTASGETKGQMTQRHKRETKALKEQIKRLGKKGKDEAARLTAELEARHQQELSQLTSNTETQTIKGLSDSLYDVSISGEKAPKKLTKAQKRREQKLKEDAEREARIAAENAELGESERVAEERELRLLLAPLGFSVKDIVPDGHCLYRSLEDQVHSLPTTLASTTAQHAGCESTDDFNFLTLRQAAADYMRQHADHFRHFVVEDDTADGAIADGDDAFEAYCNEVDSTAAWGGHVEIQALSAALHAHIQVYSVGMPVLNVGEEYKENGGPTLRLCYLRHAYGLGEHYNSVVPLVGGEESDDGVLSRMCLFFPCLAGSAWAGYKINNSLDKAFGSKEPQEPVENVLVTEAKLQFKLASIKPSRGAPPDADDDVPPPRRISKKEAASKARLQALIDQHAPSRNGR